VKPQEKQPLVSAGIASGLQMTSNQQTSFCVILYERSVSSPT